MKTIEKKWTDEDSVSLISLYCCYVLVLFFQNDAFLYILFLEALRNQLLFLENRLEQGIQIKVKYGSFCVSKSFM